MRLDGLLDPPSVVIVGDGPGESRGGNIHQNLVRFGYRGRIIPVNPKYEEVRGERCYPSLAEVDVPYECVVAAVGAERAVQAVGEAAKAGARAGVVIASGFAEAGPEGVALQAALAEAADGMPLCGPNCYGVAAFHTGFAAYSGWISEGVRPGGVALLTQSGALTHAILNVAVPRGLGLSHLVTAGNEAVTGLADYLAHVASDPETRVVACFIEGVRDLGAFIAAARTAIANGKRVVVLKTGRSQRAKTAAQAHTGALTGDDRVFDAVCDKLGIVRVDDLDELVECALLLSYEYRADAPVTIASISGGASGLAADLAERAGVPLAEFSEGTRGRLREVLPAFGSPNNPLDLTGAAAEDGSIVTAAAQVLATAPETGTIAVALNAPTADTPGERELYAGLLRRTAEAARDHPVLGFTMTSGPLSAELREAAADARVPLLQGMRETLTCLGRVRRAHRRKGGPVEAEEMPDLPPYAARLRNGETLSERSAKGLFALAGLHGPAERLVTDAARAAEAAAGLGFPVVMKIDSPDIPHKTDAGCVRLAVASPEAAWAAYEEIVANARAARPDARVDGVLVQATAPQGVDVLLGAVAGDPAAPAVTLGAGGVLAELGPPPAVRIAPLTSAEAADMLNELPGAALLDGYRGAPPADRDALITALVRFSRLVWLLRHDIAEIDINPLRVLPDGVLALDALAIPANRGEA